MQGADHPVRRCSTRCSRSAISHPAILRVAPRGRSIRRPVTGASSVLTATCWRTTLCAPPRLATIGIDDSAGAPVFPRLHRRHPRPRRHHRRRPSSTCKWESYTRAPCSAAATCAAGATVTTVCLATATRTSWVDDRARWRHCKTCRSARDASTCPPSLSTIAASSRAATSSAGAGAVRGSWATGSIHSSGTHLARWHPTRAPSTWARPPWPSPLVNGTLACCSRRGTSSAGAKILMASSATATLALRTERPQRWRRFRR